MTTRIVAEARFAATAGGVPHVAKITSTVLRSSSRREVQSQPEGQEDGHLPASQGASGQKLPPPQPAVMPERTRASMNWKKGWLVGTSDESWRSSSLPTHPG
jgi:hypothetical protein